MLHSKIRITVTLALTFCFSYKRPEGCICKALRVTGKFDNGNDAWLGSGNDASTWPVAYHGTPAPNIPGITRDGLRIGKKNPGPGEVRQSVGDAYGEGVYVSPLPEFSLDDRYAKKFELGGWKYQVVFQCRVRPRSYTTHAPISAPAGWGGTIDQIWVVKNRHDVRPYKICYYISK